MSDRETLERWLQSDGIGFVAATVVAAIREVLAEVKQTEAEYRSELRRAIKTEEENERLRGDCIYERERNAMNVKVYEEENERLRVSAEGWQEEAKRSHQNVAWREARMEELEAKVRELTDLSERRRVELKEEAGKALELSKENGRLRESKHARAPIPLTPEEVEFEWHDIDAAEYEGLLNNILRDLGALKGER